MSSTPTDTDDSTASGDDGAAPSDDPAVAAVRPKAGVADPTEAERVTPDLEGEQTATLRVYRYDPDVPERQEPHYDEFVIPTHEGMTVLDALIYARDTYDSSLTFRHSCQQAVCGSDALFVQGAQRLACRTQLSDLADPIQIDPLPHKPVEKDLVVDMSGFYDQMDAVEPYFDPDETPEDDLEEQRQSPENREKIKLSTRCIWCGACQSSCNVAAGDNKYLGPAAINKAYRFVMDEREGDDRRETRLEIVEEEHGVWRCQTQFSCTDVCPKDIPLTEHIQALKREGVKDDLKFWE